MTLRKRCVHIGEDFRWGEGAVVDAHLIDKAVEEFIGPNAVAADAKRIIRDEDCAGDEDGPNQVAI